MVERVLDAAARRQRRAVLGWVVGAVVVTVSLFAVLTELDVAPRGASNQTASQLRQASTTLAACPLSSLHVSRPLSGAGLGHLATYIRMRNISQHRCTLSGYPSVLAPLTWPAHHDRLDVARASDLFSGYSGGIYGSTKLVKVYRHHLPVVVLRPGTYASVAVEYGDLIRVGCPSITKFVVTLPQGGRDNTFTVPTFGHLCTHLFVHPIVPGVSGFLDAQ